MSYSHQVQVHSHHVMTSTTDHQIKLSKHANFDLNINNNLNLNNKENKQI